MASHEAYLRSALTRYKYPDQAKRDVIQTLQSFTDLRPGISQYVFNDGTSKELLYLEGTIPVNYKGKVYNIPVKLWLMDTHPFNPPLVYVNPTQNMQIKPGRHVDQTGRIYLPYLHEWKHPQSDLQGLIQVLVCVFGEEPPVFSKPQTGPTSSQPSYPPVQPGYPPASGLPYPAAGSAMPQPGYPSPGGSSSQAGYRPPGPSYGAAQPPPYPPYQGYPPPSSSQSSQPSYPGYTQSYPSYNHPNPMYSQPTGAAAPATMAAGNNMTITEADIRASLLSAVEDKMRRRLREIFQQAQAETDALKKTQEDLQKGRQKLDDMLIRLDKEQTEVEESIRQLQLKEIEVKDVLTKIEHSDDVNIDEVIQPSAPLYKQLLNAFAEEQATEDAIYYMGDALRKGVIDIDVFLKQVRELSRTQFMCRMIIRKCRQTAGLPDIS